MRKFEEIKKDYEKLLEIQEKLVSIEYSEKFNKEQEKLPSDKRGEFAYQQCKDYILSELNIKNLSMVNLYSMIKTEQGQLKLIESLSAWTLFRDPTNCSPSEFKIRSFESYIGTIHSYLNIEATLSAYMSNDPNYSEIPEKLNGSRNNSDRFIVITAENIAKADGFTFNNSANREL